mgnify:CR=1 FL=1
MNQKIKDDDYSWIIEYIDEITQNEFVNKKHIEILLDKIRRKINVEFDDVLDNFELPF